MLELYLIFAVNIQHSSYVHSIPACIITYEHDALCQKLETIFHINFGKGCQLIRGAKFLEVIYIFQTMKLLFFCYSKHIL